MAVTIADLESIVRELIQDLPTSMIPGDIFTYTNDSTFTLTESNVISVNTILHNNTELGSGDWSYDSSTNKVTITTSLTSGDIVEIQYTYYPNYSSMEIKKYIKAALVHISACNYKTFIVSGSNDTIYPYPSTEEKYLIALIASILIKPDNKSYALPDVRITMPRDVPTIEKIRQTIATFKHNSAGIFDIL